MSANKETVSVKNMAGVSKVPISVPEAKVVVMAKSMERAKARKNTVAVELRMVAS